MQDYLGNQLEPLATELRTTYHVLHGNASIAVPILDPRSRALYAWSATWSATSGTKNRSSVSALPLLDPRRSRFLVLTKRSAVSGDESGDNGSCMHGKASPEKVTLLGLQVHGKGRHLTTSGM